MQDLKQIADAATAYLKLKHAAREQALPKSRMTIRNCATTIRAAHRRDFAGAAVLLAEAGSLVAQMRDDLAGHLDIFYAGFVQDAQKEYAEAAITCALLQNLPLPDAVALGVDWAPYLNGLGEAVGEVRRYLLDHLRRGDISPCEPLLQAMDDIYTMLVTLDFPDAITANLRRTTDSVRGILERTRADLTLAVRQGALEQAIAALEKRGLPGGL